MSATSTTGTLRQRPPLLHYERPSNNMSEQVLVPKRNQLNTSRLQEAEQVEKKFGELAQTMLTFAGILKEQGEVLEDIENLIDDSEVNTNQAQLELLKLFKFVSADRSLIIKLLVATLVIGMLFIYLWT